MRLSQETRFHLKGDIRTLLFLVLLLLVSSCVKERKQGNATQAIPDSHLTPIITDSPTATTPQFTQSTPTTAPTLSPGVTEAQSEAQLGNILDENLPASTHSYILPLTVRHVMTDSVDVFFELDASVDGYLYYQAISPEQQETNAIPLIPGIARQQIPIGNLLPATEYRAIVALKDEMGTLQQPTFLSETWGSIHFRTASNQEPLRVGVFGDASFGDPATEALVNEMVSHNLDFVLHTGDVVAEIHENNGPLEAYALKYYKTLSPLLHQLPVYTVPGNHDYDSAARWKDSYFYYYAFPPFSDPRFSYSQQENNNQYYAFSRNNVQFLMLDSQVFFGVSGREEQEAWMAERLSDPRFRFTIPVFHVPPFFSGAVHPNDQLPVRQFWHPIFLSAHIPLVFSGHSHHYERLEADGITYIVSGGGSQILYAPGQILPQSQMFARRTHFVMMEIYSNRIELSAIDKEGELFDETVISLQ